MTPELQARLINRIGAAIDKHIRPVFKGDPRITVLVRFDWDAEGSYDVIVTSDDDEGIRAIVARQCKEPT